MIRDLVAHALDAAHRSVCAVHEKAAIAWDHLTAPAPLADGGPLDGGRFTQAPEAWMRVHQRQLARLGEVVAELQAARESLEEMQAQRDQAEDRWSEALRREDLAKLRLRAYERERQQAVDEARAEAAKARAQFEELAAAVKTARPRLVLPTSGVTVGNGWVASHDALGWWWRIRATGECGGPCESADDAWREIEATLKAGDAESVAAADTDLRNLLAVIFRDDGARTATFATLADAVTEAIRVVAEGHAARESLTDAAQNLSAAQAVIEDQRERLRALDAAIGSEGEPLQSLQTVLRLLGAREGETVLQAAERVMRAREVLRDLRGTMRHQGSDPELGCFAACPACAIDELLEPDHA